MGEVIWVEDPLFGGGYMHGGGEVIWPDRPASREVPASKNNTHHGLMYRAKYRINFLTKWICTCLFYVPINRTWLKRTKHCLLIWLQLLILLCVAIRGVPQLPDQGRPQHHQVRPEHYDKHASRHTSSSQTHKEIQSPNLEEDKHFTEVYS